MRYCHSHSTAPAAGIRRRARLLLTAALCGFVSATAVQAEPDDPKPIPVSVRKTADGFELHRGDKPYHIRGAGGGWRLEELDAAGGNSIRTWSPRRAGNLLDRAHKLGLTVTVGLRLRHERHGFDYSDAEAVARQHAAALDAVRRYKDHPALLMWGIGNEMEARGDNPKVWQAVDALARDIKEIDPHHPTMTVIAGTGHDKVRKFVEHCPHIDVLGVNYYGDLSRLPERLKRQGLDRPYVITEFGPFGWWQVEKTAWGAELEPTSTAKADTYLRSWEVAVRDQPKQCFGSYAFLWGHKQEHTHTWFGMFLPTGERTAAVDVMTKAWTGKWPKNRCPAIRRLEVRAADSAGGVADKAEHVYRPGAVLRCRVVGEDPEGDALQTRWELRPESTDKRTGGDREEVPPTIEGAVVEADGFSARVRLPEKPGAYRVFVFLVDEHSGAATANVPVLVGGRDGET
jgi:hypothetical protein